ncbi:citramalate synthase [Streptomyces violens]|uniref:citramalate synthase n=1 Tax=Streptomyces violens TaxID=66377 RepID=UPI0007C81A8D|nr:citramalate synthase [Streptomyces violens]
MTALRPAAPRNGCHILDTTLLDGARHDGIDLTVADRLSIARHLDGFGVGFLAGGRPGADPRDREFFARAREELDLVHAQLVAHGEPAPVGTAPGRDPGIRALLDSAAPVLTLTADADPRHPAAAPGTTPDEQLTALARSVRYLRDAGRRVFVEYGHFFDGYRADPGHATEAVRAAARAGAEVVVLRDTNGGSLPGHLTAVVRDVLAETGARPGIHAQNDAECAVAGTLAAVAAGATHVQCTANGYGERAGHADLFAVVAALELKYGIPVLPEGGLRELTRVSRAVAETVRLAPATHQPYVGGSAFAHKAGLHASAIKVDPDLYQHIDPELVGNTMRMLVSDMAGRASVELKAKELGIEVGDDREAVGRIIAQIKERERRGYTYESADASFELLLRQELTGIREFFTVESWRCISEQYGATAAPDEATVKLRVKDDRAIATAEGSGPADALAAALRDALEPYYPGVSRLRLRDCDVRLPGHGSGAGSPATVLVTLADEHGTWTTVGVHPDLVSASFRALHEGYVYGLLRSEEFLTGVRSGPSAPRPRSAR